MIGTTVFIVACALFMTGGVVRIVEGDARGAVIGLLAGALNAVALLWR